MTIQYSLLRFVPDPARGESVNLGIIAGDPETDEWELRIAQNLRRANAIDDHGALSVALSFAAQLQGHVAAVDQFPASGASPMDVDLLQRFASDMNHVVQLTSPTPVVADSTEAALDLLFEELIVDPESQRFRFEKKVKAVAATRRAYRDHGVPGEAISERASVVTGAYEGIFDFAVANGRVVQLVQCWSFQLPNQAELAEQVKAWAWLVRGLREHDGSLQSDAGEIEVPGHEVEIAAVFSPPTASQQDVHAFDEARAAFAEMNVTAYERDAAATVGERAAELLFATA